MAVLSIFSDEYFMQQAYKQALYAREEGEIPIGAVVVCNNKIIARAYNQTEKLQDVTAHAEILAITAASNFLGNKYLNACTLYVTVEPCVSRRTLLGAAPEGRFCYPRSQRRLPAFWPAAVAPPHRNGKRYSGA